MNERGVISSAETSCHLLQMDSGAFVKFLKYKAGIPKLECHRQGRSIRNFVFIKTHKTGGSTITNILHRFILKMELYPVIPRNNLYLGWPDINRLRSGDAIAPIDFPEDGHGRYNALVGAHTVYNRDVLSKLIPDAVYITILRNPVQHFQSSWEYWRPDLHIMANGGPTLTMSEFLQNPGRYFPFGEGSDRRLLMNSQAFDLGIGVDLNSETRSNLPSEEEIFALQKDLMENFALVLISDYMLESLVMLRRVMCWEFEDILHIALKVHVDPFDKPTRTPLLNADIHNIKKLNYADVSLFNMFNATLWARIDAEILFSQEVVRLREAIAVVQTECAPWDSWEDKARRRAVLTNELTEVEKKCLLMGMDSKDFNLYFKSVHNVPVDECHTQGRPAQKIVYIKTHKTGSSTLTNIFHRYVLKHDIQVALPLDNIYLGWPWERSSTASYLLENFSSPIDMFISGHSRYSHKELDKIVRNGKYITILRGAVSHFLSSWNHWRISEQIRIKNGTEPSLLEFLSHPDRYWSSTKWFFSILNSSVQSIIYLFVYIVLICIYLQFLYVHIYVSMYEYIIVVICGYI